MNLKQQLYRACQAYLESRARQINDSIAALQEAANDETKSSAGDKYETGRAMAHLEIEKYATQLSEVNRMMADLSRLSPNDVTDVVRPGSLVFTSRGNFYIAIHAGEHTVESQKFFIVSTGSPIAQKMIGLKAGDEFSLPGGSFSIVTIQ